MGAETKIQWCDHTFNPWWGCVRVSPGCENCYAEAFDKRVGRADWGVQAPRRLFADKHWAEPLKWNRDALAVGVRRRVFCASMADVFEGRRDLDEPRARLFALIEATPGLDWLLLTKRPQNMQTLAPERWERAWPLNVWAGTTAEDQQRANERIPRLIEVPAAVRFVSAEPLLGPIDLDRLDATKAGWRAVNGFPEPTAISAFGKWQETPMRARLQNGVDWVIVGGESGPGARPFDFKWARSIMAQCRAAGAAAFFKQAGAAPLIEMGHQDPQRRVRYWKSGLSQRLVYSLRDKHGGDLAELPADLHVREFPR